MPSGSGASVLLLICYSFMGNIQIRRHSYCQNYISFHSKKVWKTYVQKHPSKLSKFPEGKKNPLKIPMEFIPFSENYACQKSCRVRHELQLQHVTGTQQHVECGTYCSTTTMSSNSFLPFPLLVSLDMVSSFSCLSLQPLLGPCWKPFPVFGYKCIVRYSSR